MACLHLLLSLHQRLQFLHSAVSDRCLYSSHSNHTILQSDNLTVYTSHQWINLTFDFRLSRNPLLTEVHSLGLQVWRWVLWFYWHLVPDTECPYAYETPTILQLLKSTGCRHPTLETSHAAYYATDTDYMCAGTGWWTQVDCVGFNNSGSHCPHPVRTPYTSSHQTVP